jgi:membrane protein DedA with SNARE-associated domain
MRHASLCDTALVDQAVVAYAPQLVAGVASVLLGLVLNASLLPVVIVLVAGTLNGLYLWYLAYRRWKRDPARARRRQRVTPEQRLSRLSVLASGMPVLVISTGAFVAAHFTSGGSRAGLVAAGAAICGGGIGVAIGGFTGLGRDNVASGLRRVFLAK